MRHQLDSSPPHLVRTAVSPHYQHHGNLRSRIGHPLPSWLHCIGGITDLRYLQHMQGCAQDRAPHAACGTCHASSSRSSTRARGRRSGNHRPTANAANATGPNPQTNPGTEKTTPGSGFGSGRAAHARVLEELLVRDDNLVAACRAEIGGIVQLLWSRCRRLRQRLQPCSPAALRE